MRLFRRKRGRHELGAAVRDLPSTGLGWPPVAAFAVVPDPAPATRVELGFRDGSTATLDPASAQARALLSLAHVLAARD